MRPWIRALCVTFTLVTPLAKQVLASAYAPGGNCMMASMVSEETMPTDDDAMQADENASDIGESTIIE